MTEHPIMFGFSKVQEQEESPMLFISHHLIGYNPDDLEHGLWETKERALAEFALQFSELASWAKHKFLFVRRPPEMAHVRDFDSEVEGYKMIGRFSIAELKEKNGG